jgi:NAD(P)-dependent dehydrogenase (short-subunit alcohol dehydrogenase family)
MSTTLFASTFPHYRELAGRRVLITGVAPGIGASLARAFAAQGARLILQFEARTVDIGGLADEIAGSAAELRVFPCNLQTAQFAGDIMRADRGAVERLVSIASAAYGGLDLVVNHSNLAAGGTGRPGDTAHDAEDVVNALLTLPCLVTEQAAAVMSRQADAGVITNISTFAAVTPRDYALHALLTTSLAAMTAGMARTWELSGPRVHALAPLSYALDDRDPLAGFDSLASDAGPADHDEIARTALFLASRRADVLNGQLASITHSIAADDVVEAELPFAVASGR